MKNIPHKTLAWMTIIACVFAAPTHADEPNEPRAKPPEWPQDVLDVFFEDARDALVGARPNYNAPASPLQSSIRRGGRPGRPSNPVTSTDGATNYDWSKLVDADVIESELKRQLALLEPLVATSSAFKGGGYRDCRRHFNWIATLFAVASDYDGDVRWQDSAEALSQLFGRAGFNCKVGTDQSFREAQLRVGDLAELVRGGRPDTPAARPDVGWAEIADRTPLMERMEVALHERISPHASDSRSLKSNAEDLHHEAQLLAVLAQVISAEGFDYSDEDTYQQYAGALREAAVKFAQATDLDNYEAAREALGQMEQACTNCHDEWR